MNKISSDFHAATPNNSLTNNVSFLFKEYIIKLKASTGVIVEDNSMTLKSGYVP